MASPQNNRPDPATVRGIWHPPADAGIRAWSPWVRVLAIGWLAWGGLSLAAQLRPVPPEELASRAEAVVVGKVTAIETVREGKEGMVTRVELEVRDVWKGPATNRMVLTQPSGTLGSRRVVTMGDAEYRLAEEVVVFAVRNRSGEWLTLELAQGKFHVERPPSGPAWVVGHFFGGDPSGPGARPANRLPLTLESLGRRVKGNAR